MPNAYFTTQLNDRNAWDFTKITVPDKVKPYYQVVTGGQHRCFILTTPLHKVQGLPHAEAGRVKWYRKKIQENT